jgi:hypothetical protein
MASKKVTAKSAKPIKGGTKLSKSQAQSVVGGKKALKK